MSEDKNIRFRIITKHVKKGPDALALEGFCLIKTDGAGHAKTIERLLISSYSGDGSISPIRGRIRPGKGLPFIRGYRIHRYVIEIAYNDAPSMDLQNKLLFFVDGEEIGSINYAFRKGEGTYRNTGIVRKDGRSYFFRQTINNRMWLTIRPEILYDRPGQRFRLWIAWFLAKVTPNSDTILMYEKESSRYEESASVLFERLVELGYDNVKYIIDEECPDIEKIPKGCREHIIYKNSFRHLIEFFRCKKFIGTETMDHSLQLRTANKHVMRKLRSRDVAYVFLQHGVMYMVSLDADVRVGFRPGDRQLDRIVVSSEEEARHFIELGGFDRKALYITGLAKFDRSYREKNADLIMIMPTWRRWESNEAINDFESTGYYRMLLRMVEAVPEEFRSKIVIMPHPLMREMMESAHTGLEGYLRPGMSHDEVLRKTRLLITDYSSIAYDAFYRGANVVFCWEDMDECMKQYGNAHLMLTEDKAFGAVTYTDEERAKAVEKSYVLEQDPDYIKRYRKIVEFHDGRNTDRIIEKLREDMII